MNTPNDGNARGLQHFWSWPIRKIGPNTHDSATPSYYYQASGSFVIWLEIRDGPKHRLLGLKLRLQIANSKCFGGRWTMFTRLDLPVMALSVETQEIPGCHHPRGFSGSCLIGFVQLRPLFCSSVMRSAEE